MDSSDIENALRFDDLTPSHLFSILNTISRYVLEHGATDKIALDAIIRLRDLIEKGAINDSTIEDAIFSLCRDAGLFPYLPRAKLSWRDQLAFEFFRGPSETGYIFHREQWQAFQLLVSGKSLILSAPTSFGKSALILAYIAQQRPRCVVIIVPTIALLDQFRRRLSHYFEPGYSIITRNDQAPLDTENRIYVLTQERLLDRTDISEIDLLAIDEYYKLDSERERQSDSNRATLLNVALRKYLFAAKQIFFLGPAVADVVMRDDLRARFTNFPSNIATVAVDVHDYKSATEPYKTLASLLLEHKSDKSLVYSKSPPAARKLINYLAQKSPLPVGPEILELADWLAEYYHPRWSLVSALRAGYGLHHGSIPRSVAQALVRHFNEGSLNALICTSTLIEGVNTAAKNVFILDKKISNSNYDYFDFRNIAGRSGRMGHHFIGRIFLFHEPPKPEDFEIKVPALAQDEEIPDAILVNLPNETLNRDLLSRKQALFDRSSLPAELIKRFAAYGMGTIEIVSDRIANLLDAGDRSLLWRGYVKYAELLAVFSMGWDIFRFNKKRLTAEAAAFYANRLRGAQLFRSYFDGLVRDKDELEHNEIVERGFRALGIFDYSIPKLLLDMEALVNYHCNERGLEEVSYSLMAQFLDNFFAHHWVKAMEEYGIPIPLGRKLEFLIRDTHTLEEALDMVRTYCRFPDGERRLTPLELSLIDGALHLG
jgi:DEAD/DEAH box helicase/Helicase conserved C-terminal domain